MPNRILREGILTSEKVCRLTWVEEVFYRRLMSIVDDYGRCEANSQALRARLYPMQVDKVSTADIDKWMLVTAEAGLCRLYCADGKKYLQIENFGQPVRSKSRCPEPESNCLQMKSNESNCLQMQANESKCLPIPYSYSNAYSYPNANSNTAASQKSDSPLAPEKITFDFASKGWKNIREEDFKLWHEAYPAVDFKLELSRAANWLVDDPKRKKINYRKFLTNWFSKVQDYGGGRQRESFKPAGILGGAEAVNRVKHLEAMRNGK